MADVMTLSKQSIWKMHVYYNLPLTKGNLFGLFKSTLKCLYSNCLIHVFHIKCLSQVALQKSFALQSGIILFFFLHEHNTLYLGFVMELPQLCL